MSLRTLTTSVLSHLRYGSRLDPARDWYVLLTISGIVLAAVIGWNVWAFDTVANGGVIGAAATSTPPVFSQNSLDTIHAIFTDRANEELKYTTGTYRYADPSQ